MDLGEPIASHKKAGSQSVTTQSLVDYWFSWYNTGVAIGNINNGYRYQNTNGQYPTY